MGQGERAFLGAPWRPLLHMSVAALGALLNLRLG
jgi:hypothetical protein